MANPPQGGRKNTTKGTIKRSAKPPHQTGHKLKGQEEGKTQVTPPNEKQKGCVSTKIARKGPNGKHSKDVTPKSKPRPLRGRGGQNENIQTWRTT
jgi:hypothetical protein